ncbi:chemotaxis-specific protein-glutamate methyltransferase CheB [Oscillochloris sp. ZM17-4]|uniref:chemotaxis-specific protein-glutamate methyltransferase CheB n=1 Tax=Oscillochloris sp. ZM17-4 TaxID=2866714 RepID=UPI001C72C9D0|nr:chemotaxis-specific protein-glutamate methyltransferase CheB [Oscillochloris sp. ZM17-4]MBX0326760.1 chemotaxis-specific protein-glutamate methyltransferase CheB [Oscillochloris sp. ZM17-4]
MSQPLRILIVDDSALMRRMIRAMLDRDPDLTVVGEAADGREAIARAAELRPDLITLDVRMPVMDGVETTRQIMAYQPTPILVLTASLSRYDIDITFQMLGAGALDVMEKPQLSDGAALERARIALVRKIKLLARVKVVTHLRGRRKQNVELSMVNGELPNKQATATSPSLGGTSTTDHSPFTIQHSPFPVVVIGASTGGPGVVRQILAGLPRGYGAAVVVVQHIAQGFSAGMVEWMAGSSALPIMLADAGAAIRPGQVIVAPDRVDLLLDDKGRVKLSALPLLLQRPAIDITMQSVAEAYGPLATGVLLTGMGRDGALGMRSIRRAGGYTIAQDEASCTIFGMPKAAIDLGAAHVVLPPDKIIEALIARVDTPRRGIT